MVFLATLLGSLIMMIRGVPLFALLVFIVIGVYIYALKKMRELLKNKELLKAYLLGNSVVWLSTLVLYGGCVNVTFSSY